MYILIDVTLLSFPATDIMNKPQKYDAYSVSSSVCNAAVDVKATFLCHGPPHIFHLGVYIGTL